MRRWKQTIAPTPSDELDVLLCLRLRPAQRNTASNTDDEEGDVPVQRVFERAPDSPTAIPRKSRRTSRARVVRTVTFVPETTNAASWSTSATLSKSVTVLSAVAPMCVAFLSRSVALPSTTTQLDSVDDPIDAVMALPFRTTTPSSGPMATSSDTAFWTTVVVPRLQAANAGRPAQ